MIIMATIMTTSELQRVSNNPYGAIKMNDTSDLLLNDIYPSIDIQGALRDLNPRDHTSN